MRFSAVSAMLALGFALAARAAPVAIGNPSGVSISGRNSPRGFEVLNPQVKHKEQEEGDQEEGDQGEGDQDEEDQDEEDQEEGDQEEEQKKKSKMQRISNDLQKAAYLRNQDQDNDNKNFVVIVIEIIIIIDESGRWAPPKYETMTQVGYEKPGATDTQTQWITDDAIKYVMGGTTTAMGAPPNVTASGAAVGGASTAHGITTAGAPVAAAIAHSTKPAAAVAPPVPTPQKHGMKY